MQLVLTSDGDQTHIMSFKTNQPRQTACGWTWVSVSTLGELPSCKRCLMYVEVHSRTSKECHHCHQIKQHSEFGKNASAADGFLSKCMPCERKYQNNNKKRVRGIAKHLPVTVTIKHCPKCNQDKKASEFWRDNGSKTRLTTHCKSCARDRYNNLVRISDLTAKLCRGCNETKDISQFPKSKYHSDGHHTRCLSCRRICNRINLPRSRRSSRNSRLRSTYGITIDEYEAMLETQSGVCAICREPETIIRKGRLSDFAVDHDHVSGLVRGILCQKCNQGIGMFRNREDLLLSAAIYLKNQPK